MSVKLFNRLVRVFLATFIITSYLPLPLRADTIYVGGENYAPYVDVSLPEQGWMWAVAKAAFSEAGYQAEFIAGPWKRALEIGKKGEAWQAIYPAYITEERQKFYLFSDPMAFSALGVFKLKNRRDIPYSGQLDDLGGYRIGMCRGCLITPEFDRANFLNKIEVVDTELAIQMLLRGRIDMMAGNAFTDGWKIRSLVEKGIIPRTASTNIEFAQPPLAWRALHMAFSKAAPNAKKMRQDFNKALSVIAQNGEIINILKRFDVDPLYVPLLGVMHN